MGITLVAHGAQYCAQHRTTMARTFCMCAGPKPTKTPSHHATEATLEVNGCRTVLPQSHSRSRQLCWFSLSLHSTRSESDMVDDAPRFATQNQPPQCECIASIRLNRCVLDGSDQTPTKVVRKNWVRHLRSYHRQCPYQCWRWRVPRDVVRDGGCFAPHHQDRPQQRMRSLK